MRYSFYAFIFSLSSVIYLNFDRIMINKFFGSVQVGTYGAYYIAFITSAAFIFNTFNLVFFPMLSGSKNKDAIFKKINKMITRFSILVLLFMLLFGIIILKLYGSKYQFNFWLCLLFDIASVLSVVNALYGWCMNAIGEKGARITAIAAIAAAIINVSINIILIPTWGFFGAVLAVIAAYLVSIIIILYKKDYFKLDGVMVNNNYDAK